MIKRINVLFATILALPGNSSFAQSESRYTTITESECNEEILLLPNGEGSILNTCRLENGSQQDDVKELNITWVMRGNELVVNSGAESFGFTMHSSMSCAPFGRAGSSPGIVGRGKSYWKSPVSCK